MQASTPSHGEAAEEAAARTTDSASGSDTEQASIISTSLSLSHAPDPAPNAAKGKPAKGQKSGKKGGKGDIQYVPIVVSQTRSVVVAVG